MVASAARVQPARMELAAGRLWACELAEVNLASDRPNAGLRGRLVEEEAEQGEERGGAWAEKEMKLGGSGWLADKLNPSRRPAREGIIWDKLSAEGASSSRPRARGREPVMGSPDGAMDKVDDTWVRPIARCGHPLGTHSSREAGFDRRFLEGIKLRLGVSSEGTGKGEDDGPGRGFHPKWMWMACGRLADDSILFGGCFLSPSSPAPRRSRIQERGEVQEKAPVARRPREKRGIAFAVWI